MVVHFLQAHDLFERMVGRTVIHEDHLELQFREGSENLFLKSFVGRHDAAFIEIYGNDD